MNPPPGRPCYSPQPPPPPYYSYYNTNDDERTPLFHARQPKSDQPSSLLLTIGIFVVAFLLGYIIQTPLDSSYRQMTREMWNNEKEVHEKWVANTKLEWKNEEEVHEKWVSNAKLEKQRWEEDRMRRDEQDRLDREEHERKRHEIQWNGQQRHRCIRHGTREYTATLSNVPLGYNAMDECKNKTLWFNGRDVHPTHCEDPGSCGSVIGHWEINFNEPDCSPSWGQISDKGCWPYGSRIRRYDAELVNIAEWDSWKEVCSSMGAKYGNVDLPVGEAQCTQCWGKKCGSGYWATWYLQDERC